ncbi:HpcH/HpaI aldolase family protein [Curtobacterium sp. VKM Ac-2887]|uniref:HpcH/HpaI aldolase family protein n=1 Tax=Curtobacterium sp. VKM Ac-2887 TaxID=2783819 RepID=UPI00188BDB79|nr:aldolase/citrate lyase family protein [Curtobacterium sp. VKM Ac-2887]MBF4585682.1 aldolase [Curtobacterium sp. VKM Ac-2887]
MSNDSPYSSSPTAADAPTNPVRQVIAAQGTIIGPWVLTKDPGTVAVLAATAVDFLVFDCQHGPHDLATVGPLLRAAAAQGKPTLLRVPSADSWIIMRALDLGAAGVIVPMVSSAAEAESARAATRYPPLGERSYGPLQPAPGDVFDPQDGPMIFVMIENASGLDAVREIAAIDGIDGLFIGPVDLALGIGAMDDGDLRGALASPLLAEATAAIAAAASASGKLLAGAVFSPDHARGMAGAGMRLHVLGTDAGWLTTAAAELVRLGDELR